MTTMFQSDSAVLYIFRSGPGIRSRSVIVKGSASMRIQNLRFTSLRLHLALSFAFTLDDLEASGQMKSILYSAKCSLFNVRNNKSLFKSRCGTFYSFQYIFKPQAIIKKRHLRIQMKISRLGKQDLSK
jgi:hypothetical protein